MPEVKPRPNGSHDPAPAFLTGDSEMAALVRAKDWSATPLGPPEGWSRSIKAAVSICLSSRFPILLWLGPELRVLYNDACIPFLGDAKHPAALGAPGRAVWGEIWPLIGPMHDEVRAGRAATVDHQQMFFARRLPREEVYVTFGYSPIFNEDKRAVEGTFCACTETTGKFVGERRLATLRDMGARTAEARTVDAACRGAAEVLNSNPLDVPFAAIYLLNERGTAARRVAGTRLPADPAIFPLDYELGGAPGPWPLAQVAKSGEAAEVDVLGRIGAVAAAPWPDAVETGFVLPLTLVASTEVIGFLVVGISPRRVLDAEYLGFLHATAGRITTIIGDGRAFEAEHSRAEALAEIDQVKTAFFANVSHEFRTPLTLMLGLLEEVLAGGGGATVDATLARVEVAHRNCLRLMKLVNALLYFARVEAGRSQACYAPTDLSAYTAELASNFRPAIERAGLKLIVDTPPLSQPVYVDHGMWETIVLNLLSNACKFTFHGEIAVELRDTGAAAVLRVCDTGTGIAAQELPHLFDRFHRVEGAGGRSDEGSGIGLALVRELTRQHGGQVTVESKLGGGSQFAISIPLGMAHLPADRIIAARSEAPARFGPQGHVEEASHWLSQGTGTPVNNPLLHRKRRTDAGATILLADDNADMRGYVRRLLADHGYVVETVTDGQAALEALRRRRPDLVLADVMMPRLSGIELLQAVRRDPKLRDLPVIVLSARAGEEARLEGLTAGADDYLIKPFSARELLARVDTHLGLVQLRQEMEERLRASEVRLKAASDLVGLSSYTWDPATGALHWDARLKAMWGLPPDAPVDHALWLSAIHPDDRPQVEAALAACLDPAGDGICRMEYRVIGITDRVERWVSTYCRTTFADGRPASFIGAVLEVTERKRVEQALRESEERQILLLALGDRLQQLGDSRAAMEVGAEMLGRHLGADRVAYSELTGAGEILEINCCWHTPAMPEVSGHHRLDELGAAMADALRAGQITRFDDARVSGRAMGGAAAAHFAHHVDAVLNVPFVKDGVLAAVLFVHQARPRHWTDAEVELAREVGERMRAAVERARAEAALRASEELFRQFAEHTVDVLWIMDAATGRIEYLSPAFERTWRMPREAMLRHWSSWLATVHPDDREVAAISMQRAQAGEANAADYRLAWPGGAVRCIRATLFPIRDDRGGIRHIAGIARDMTPESGRRVYLVASDDVVLQSLRPLLRGVGYAVKVFPSVRSFQEVAPVLVPGCVLLVLGSAPGESLGILNDLKQRQAELPVIVVSGGHSDIEVAVRAMRAGAVDFIQDAEDHDKLLCAVASALIGIDDAASQDRFIVTARARVAELSGREREVIEKLVAGGTNKSIARELALSPRTVEVHRARAMERLGASTIQEAVLMAAAAGLGGSGTPTAHVQSGAETSR